MVHNDTKMPSILEAIANISGLGVKYTAAPKFVFLGEEGKEEGEKMEKEVEDEFTDVFEQFGVADLSRQERTYIKRFE